MMNNCAKFMSSMLRRLAVRVTRYLASFGEVKTPDVKLNDSECGKSSGLYDEALQKEF